MTDIAQLGVKIVQEGLKETNDRLGELVQKAGEAEDAIEKIRRTSQRGFAGLSRAAEQANADVIRLAKSIGGLLVGALGAVSSLLSVREFIRLADTWSDLSARVQNAIGPHEKAANVMKKLSGMARVSYSDLGITTEAFINNAQSLQELGLSTDQQLKYQEALNNALVVSGARADRAASVQHAFSSALALGALRGDQLNSVLINGDRISKSLAKELGTTTNELRKLGAQGKITREVMLRALINDYQILRDEAEEMPATVGDGFMLIKNASLVLMGTWDKFIGVSGRVAEGLVRVSDIMMKMADNIQAFTKWFITIGLVLAVNILPKMTLFKVAVLAGNAALASMRNQLAGVALSFTLAGGGASGLSFIIGTALTSAIAKAKLAFATFLPTAIFQAALIVIGLLVSKFYSLQKAVGGVGVAFSLIWQALKWEIENFDRTFEMIMYGMMAFYYKLVALGELIKEVFRSVVFDIKKQFTALPDHTKAVFLTLAIGAITAMDKLMKVVYDTVTAIIDAFRDAPPILEAIFSTVPAAIGKGVISAANFVIDTVKDMLRKAISALKMAFPLWSMMAAGRSFFGSPDGAGHVDPGSLPDAIPEPPRSGYKSPGWVTNTTGALEGMRDAALEAARAILKIPRPRDPSWERHGSPAERAMQQAEIYTQKGLAARAGADGQGNPYVAGMRGAMQAAQDAADQAREDAANLPSIEEITLDALNSPSGGGGGGGGGRGGKGGGGKGGAGGSGEKTEAQKLLEQQQKALADLSGEVDKYRQTVYMTALEEEIWNKQKETGAFLNPQLAEQVERMVRELDNLRKTQEVVRQIADDTKQAFESAFTTIITGSGKARDALRQLLDSLAQMAASRAFNALWGMVSGDKLTRALAVAMGGVGRNANGTNNWRGGLTSVNERGGEIIDLPNGSRVIPHDISRKMARNSQNSSGTLRVIIEPSGEFRTEMDTRALGAAVQVVQGYDKSAAMNKKIRRTVRNPRSIG